MNIYAKEGTLVVYTGEGGYPRDKDNANKYLQVGTVYEVSHTEVGGWHTDVFLKGFDTAFNSVMFKEKE